MHGASMRAAPRRTGRAALTPPSLHRAHYRKHVNPRLRHGSWPQRHTARKPCDPGSRWIGYAFTKRDIGKVLEVVDLNRPALISNSSLVVVVLLVPGGGGFGVPMGFYLFRNPGPPPEPLPGKN